MFGFALLCLIEVFLIFKELDACLCAAYFSLMLAGVLGKTKMTKEIWLLKRMGDLEKLAYHSLSLHFCLANY